MSLQPNRPTLDELARRIDRQEQRTDSHLDDCTAQRKATADALERIEVMMREGRDESRQDRAAIRDSISGVHKRIDAIYASAASEARSDSRSWRGFFVSLLQWGLVLILGGLVTQIARNYDLILKSLSQ